LFRHSAYVRTEGFVQCARHCVDGRACKLRHEIFQDDLTNDNTSAIDSKTVTRKRGGYVAVSSGYCWENSMRDIKMMAYSDRREGGD
jgi:hypothetical protein